VGENVVAQRPDKRGVSVEAAEAGDQCGGAHEPEGADAVIVADVQAS
jgi:hypothetical protein